MATYSKELLSESLEGLGILVVDVGSPGTLIHSSATSAPDLDEVWIYAYNINTSSIKLTLQWGGVAAKDGMEATIPGESGLILVAPGLLLQDNDIRAYAVTASGIVITGFVNKITA